MQKISPILISINAACEALDLGRTSIYSLISARRLETVKLGRRTLVKVSSIQSLIAENEVA
jgi:excisionase family DNA binding protein